jgi:ubiquinone/menaquinone biosynthesis C-methylase UbiE
MPTFQKGVRERVSTHSPSKDGTGDVPSFTEEDANAAYRRRPGKTYHRIFSDAYGDDYPVEAEPHSFVTKTDLARIVQWLAIRPGSVLVDLGCGRGGPGLWLARATGADLIGVDYSANAIELANQRITEFGLMGRASFLRRDLRATGLPDQSCDGAVSLDVVMFVPDKSAVIREVARILRPGARFIFTAFEGKDLEHYRLPLQENGFEIEVYEEKPDWQRRQLIFYQRAVDEQAALFEEMGEGARGTVGEAEHFLAVGFGDVRHVLVVGRRL